MHRICNGAGWICCQHSVVQFAPMRILLLARIKYFKRLTRYVCILGFYFSTENKQMFLFELWLKFNKYFKMVLPLNAVVLTSPTVSFIHSPKTISVYQHICLLICSPCSCTIRFCRKTAQKKEKKIIFKADYFSYLVRGAAAQTLQTTQRRAILLLLATPTYRVG